MTSPKTKSSIKKKPSFISDFINRVKKKFTTTPAEQQSKDMQYLSKASSIYDLEDRMDELEKKEDKPIKESTLPFF